VDGNTVLLPGIISRKKTDYPEPQGITRPKTERSEATAARRGLDLAQIMIEPAARPW